MVKFYFCHFSKSPVPKYSAEDEGHSNSRSCSDVDVRKERIRTGTTPPGQVSYQGSPASWTQSSPWESWREKLYNATSWGKSKYMRVGFVVAGTARCWYKTTYWIGVRRKLRGNSRSLGRRQEMADGRIQKFPEKNRWRQGECILHWKWREVLFYQSCIKYHLN